MTRASVILHWCLKSRSHLSTHSLDTPIDFRDNLLPTPLPLYIAKKRLTYVASSSAFFRLLQHLLLFPVILKHKVKINNESLKRWKKTFILVQLEEASECHSCRQPFVPSMNFQQRAITFPIKNIRYDICLSFPDLTSCVVSLVLVSETWKPGVSWVLWAGYTICP